MTGESERGAPLRFGLLVPCRNEEAVIERKLENLARLEWPRGSHRIVIVDDGSTDGTRERASALVAERFGEVGWVRATVVGNRREPGKAGAIRQGLGELAHSVDIVLLTDADVVFDPRVLMHMASAFELDQTLGMACAAQEFVRDLATDGAPLGVDGGPPVPAFGVYDRWTAVVRRIESRAGALFSVHGQCLAWRAALGLEPTPGVAADDLELMLQARDRGAAVRLVPRARFLEVKTPAGPIAESQALRRARAYFQVLDRARPSAFDSGAARVQWLFYRYLPGASPWLVPLALGGFVLAAGWIFGPLGFVLSLLTLLVLGATSTGRGIGRLLRLIARARREEANGTLSDRWEMQRS